MSALRQLSPRSGFTPGKLLRLLLALLLGWQLFMASQHHHDISEQHDDCVACDLALQPSGDVPAALPPLLAAALLVWFQLARLTRPCFLRTAPPHLLPLSQAPPVR